MTRQLSRTTVFIAVAFAIVASLWVLGSLAPRSADRALDQAQRTQAAATEPVDFSGTTLDGSTFHLADYKGKVVLVNFWATWCGPCVKEVPDLIALQKRFGPRGFTVVGLSQDKTLDPVIPFVKHFKVNYPVMLEPEGVADKMGVEGLPTSFLMDRKGKVVYMTPGVVNGISMEDIWAPEIKKVI